MEKFVMILARGTRPTPPPPPPPVYWLNVNRTDGLADSDRVALEVFFNAGLCSSLEYMTEDEAAAVVDLPTFVGLAIVNWDWSKLTGLSGNVAKQQFMRCKNLAFENLGDIYGTTATRLDQTFRESNINVLSLPAGFASKTTTFYLTFYDCSNLALTSLPDDFGAVGVQMSQIFNNCPKLALTSLPSKFGAVATDLSKCFANCSSLALTSLPDDFGAVATDLSQCFANCSSLALTSLPSKFASRATSMHICFNSCSSLALTSLPDDFGAVASTQIQTFTNCSNLALTSLPSKFSDNVSSFDRCFAGCSKLPNIFDIGSQNFGAKCNNFFQMFFNSGVKNFVGRFDFSGINSDSINMYVIQGFNRCFNDCTHVEFVPNTLKYSAYTTQTGLSRIDNFSLFSLAVCLYDWWDESAGDFVGNEGKTFGVTQLQKNTLDASDYESGYSYTDYISYKGWNLTIF